MRTVAGVVASLVLLAGCGASAAGSADEGEQVSLDFSAQTVAGEDFDGASLEGRPTVLWFWAPWCPTCQGQAPAVGEIAGVHGEDVNVVGVGGLDDDPDAIAAFAAEVDPAVTDLYDPDGEVWRHFGVTEQSTYVVVDADGDQVAAGRLSDDELRDAVDQMVG